MVQARVRAVLGVADLPATALYSYPTVVALAAHLRARAAAAPARADSLQAWMRGRPRSQQALLRRASTFMHRALGAHLSAEDPALGSRTRTSAPAAALPFPLYLLLQYLLLVLATVTPLLVVYVGLVVAAAYVVAAPWSEWWLAALWPAMLAAALVVKALLLVAGQWLLLPRGLPTGELLAVHGWVHCRWAAARALRATLLPELAGFLARTPALPWLYRALGARIGAGALVDTAGVQDPCLFSLGAGSKLHAGVEVSPALLVPAGVFGARPALLFARVELGAGCEAGHRAVLPAGSRLADGQHLRPRAAPTHAGAVGKGPLADAPHFCAEERLHWSLGLLAAAAAFFLHAVVLFPPLLLNTTLVGLALGGNALDILAQRLDASAAEPKSTVLLWSLLFVAFIQYVTLPLAGVLQAALVVLFKRAALGRLPPGTDVARSRWLLWRFALFARLQDDPNLAAFRGVFGSTQVAVWYLRALGSTVAGSAFLGALHVTVPDALDAADAATSGGESAAYCLDAAGVVQSVRLGVGAVVGNSAALYPGSAVGRFAVLGNDSVLPAGDELGENVRMQGQTRYVVAPDEKLPGGLLGGSAAAAPRLYDARVTLALWAAAPVGPLLVWLAAVPATLGVASVAGWGAVPVYIAAVGVGAALNALWLRALPRLCGMRARWAAGEAGVFSVAAQLCHGLLSPPSLAGLQGTPFLPAALRLVGFEVGRGVQLLCCAPLERTLVSFGAGAVVDSGCQVEGHYLEPLKFKYHATSVGARAWVQAGARVMPLVSLGDGARLLPASTMLPGEAVLPGWVWGGGVPASPLLEPAELEGARSAKL